MDAAQQGVQFNFDIVASWRAAYIPNLNREKREHPVISQHTPVMQPGDRCYSPISSDSMGSFQSLLAEDLAHNGGGHSLHPEPEIVFIDGPNVVSYGFPVNRRSLKELIDVKGPYGTTMLLHRIMCMTNTHLYWPQDLENTTEDYLFVQVYGEPSNIAWARCLILGHLHTQGSLVKINIAVPEGDMTKIFGETGATVHRIMESTQTQILFGDPDRHDAVGRHKAVLYGDVECLEEGRKSLRSTMPFTMIFDMHFARHMSNLYYSQYLQEMEAKLNIKLGFFSTVVRNVYRVVIQGTDEKAQSVQDALEQLFPTATTGAPTMPVFRLEMPVSEDIVAIFTDDEHAIIKIVMANTDTEVVFLEPSEPGDCAKLIISGSVADILSARRELIGFMPVELSFEIDEYDSYTDAILDLANKYALQLAVERRELSNTLYITMRGTERFVHNIYDAYQEVLRLKENIADDERTVTCLVEECEDCIMESFDAGEGNFAFEEHLDSSDWLLLETGRHSLDGGWSYVDLAHRSSTPKHFYAAEK